MVVRWKVMSVIAPLAVAASPALAGPSGVYCANEGNDVMVVRSAPGNAIEFQLSSWGGGMHHCGVGGTAESGSGAWLFQQDGCAITIREDGGGLVLRAASPEACSQHCGARHRIDTLHFPAAGRIATTADPAYFEAGLMESSPDCP
jgi:hypothetical protein